MKKFSLILLAVVAIVIAACSSNGASTPKETVDIALSKAQAGDYDAVIDMMVRKDGKALSKEDADQLKAMVKEKAEKSNNKIVSYDVQSEEISEDGNSAVVTSEITYENGKTKTDKTEVIKGEDGKWHLSLGK